MTRFARSLAVYQWLRAANPHLPPADTIIAEGAVKISFGPDLLTLVTITVVVELPDMRLASDG